MILHKPALVRLLLACLALAGMTVNGSAQDEEERFLVERIKVVDQTKPVFNIYVDEDNNKWIGNSDAVFFVEAKDRAEKIEIPSGQQSLLQLPGGDADIRWSKQEISQILGEAKITTAAYDKRDRMLWIGTDGWGIFKIQVNDSRLRLIEEIYIDNSKLRSDFINLIYISPEGKVWIATEDGAMLIENGSSSIHQKFFNVQTISGNRRQTWATGDGLVWTIDNRDNWSPIEINFKEIEGEMHDIAFDDEGRIWIASNIMTSYKIETDSYQHFGPGQYFTSQFVNYVSVDDDGTIWVGTDDKGVYIIEKASTITVTSNLDKGLSCEGGINDAKVSLRAIGGQPPYTFAWSDGGAGEVRNDLGAGLYTVTVTDVQGSSKSEEIEIMDPAITLTVSEEQQVSEDGGADGVAALEAQGGVPGYTAIWSNGKTGAMITGLTAGNYAVTVTDQAGCTADGEVMITTAVGELTASIEITTENRCAGVDGANVMVNVSGGKSPFTYEWQEIAGGGPEVKGLSSGTYVVSVTDALGSMTTATVEIPELELFNASVDVIQSASTGASDGRARVVVDGGSEPFTYVWSNGESNQEAITLAPGEQAVTVTDSYGCTAVGTVTISEDILPLEVSILQQDDIKCAGEMTAAISADVTGGKGPYSYLWSTGAEGEVLSGVGAGSYSVTVTDALGTSTVFESEVIQPEPLIINTNVTQSATANNADGVAEVNVSGGDGAYTYAWENGGTEATIDGVRAGTYLVTVTDASGCTGTSSVTMTEDILPLSLSIEQQGDILCNGDATGGLIADISGGKSPYQYTWNDGVQTQVRENLPSGVYSVTVTDVTGASTVFESELTEPEAIVVNTSVEASATANNADGIAVARATGGVGEYTYAWSTGSQEARASELEPGDHTVTVTDANGCSATGTVAITEDILPLGVEVVQTESIDCNGASTASVDAQVRGGKGPFAYSWASSNPAWTGDATGATVTGIPAGVLTLTVTDVQQTQITFQLEITEPSKVVANAIAVSPASTGGSDGSAKVNGTGGTENYTPEWDNGEVTQTATQLSPGLHTVTITDEAGCTAVAEVTITEDILPLDAQVSANVGILCKGGSTGELTVEVSGGKGPFAYEWSTGSTEATVSALPVGSYDVTITDAVGTAVVRNYSLIEPPALGANIDIVSVASTNTADGIIEVVPNGGTEPYAYEWSNGITDQRIESLAAGEYAVTVTDANGCTFATSAEVTENILPLTVDVERDNSMNLCYGDEKGVAKVLPNGGKSPYTYEWSDGSTEIERTDLGEGSYTITVTDVLGAEATAMVMYNTPSELSANVASVSSASTDESDGSATVDIEGGTAPYAVAWSNGETEATANSLGAGSFSVTVTDANGCVATSEATMTEDILPLTVGVEQDNSPNLCHGDANGIARIVPSGGKAPFTYAWSDGSAEMERNDLGEGSFTITVTDALGSQATTIVEYDTPSELVTSIASVTSASTDESDGTASVTIDGGVKPYSVAWSNGETDATATSLGAGSYTVTVTDANGCTATAELEMTEDILPLSVTVERTSEVSCAGTSDATATAVVSGGKKPYTISWSNGGAGESVSGLGAGQYSVTITDAVDQSTTGEFSIEEPEPLTGEIVDVRAAAAEHVPDGKARVQMTGGAGGYFYTWDNGESGDRATGLSIGTHSVTVTDANGCSTVLSTEITKKILPELTAETLESGEAVRMEQLQFEADSTNIIAESVPTLNELYQFLYDNPTIVVEIGGHTNGLPEHDYCDSLSTLRAKEVAVWLVDSGIDEKRVYYKGYGKRRPIATNRTPEGRRKNQRVEVRILRLDDN